MRAVYRNPKELATAVKDIIDTYLEDLMSYETLEEKIIRMIDANEERLIKNGKVEGKIANVLGRERVEIITKILAER